MKHYGYLILILLSHALHADQQYFKNSEENYINYLAKITNNSKRTLKIVCSDFKWRPVLFKVPSLLNSFMFTYNYTPIEEHGNNDLQNLQDLYYEKQERSDRLFRDLANDQQIAQDQSIQNYDRLIKQQWDKMRPVIHPGQTIDGLPCRLFRAIDTPQPKPAGWTLPECYLQDNEIKILVVDTNTPLGCSHGQIRIEARTKTFTTFCCVNNVDDMGVVHLIINPDDTLQLVPMTPQRQTYKYLPPRPAFK